MSTELTGLMCENWLKACPTGVLVTDGQKILWSNPAFERMTQVRMEHLRQEDADPLLEKLVSTDGLLNLKGDDGSESWLLCETADLGERDKGVTLRFFRDVSGEINVTRERDALAKKVEELDLTDPLTGLANPRALGNALNAQVTRSRRYHNPLSVALVQVHTPDASQPLADAVVLSVSRFLRDRLRWADVIGRHSADVFMLILPETRHEDVLELLRNIRDDGKNIMPPPPHDHVKIELQTGLAEWSKGLDVARLVTQAEQDLAAAGHSDGG